MSVSVLALTVGVMGVVQADVMQPMDVITQVNGQSGTVTVSVPVGQEVLFGSGNNNYDGLSNNDYNKLSDLNLISGGKSPYNSYVSYYSINANTLKLEGGGSLSVGGGNIGFSSNDIKTINIDNGILIDIQDGNSGGGVASGLKNLYPNSNIKEVSYPDLNIKDGSFLRINSAQNSIYNSFNSINGSGGISLINTKTPIQGDGSQFSVVGKLYIYGSGSHFSGSIKGDGNLDMAGFPSSNTKYVSSGSNSSYSVVYPLFSVNSSFSDFKQVKINNLGLFDISGNGYHSGEDITPRQMGNTFLHAGAEVDVGELRVAGGYDNGYFTESTSNGPVYGGGGVDSNNATLVVSDEGTSLHTEQLVVGQQTGRVPSSVMSLFTSNPDLGFTPFYGASHGTLWIANGAALFVSGGGINGGVYLGNSAGNGPDDRTNGMNTNPYYSEGEAHGVIHVTGNQVGYDASGNFVNPGTVGQSAQLNVQNGGLWIGPVDGGKGSGDIIVDHGGQLNLDSSFAVLGGQNGAGNIAINQGGTATVTGMKPLGLVPENQGSTFNTQRQGTFTVSDGGSLNIGTATSAGSLKLYGDLNLAGGSTTTFYEGTTSDKGNKGDAYNSHAEVSGNVTLGGNIQIAGIAGQNRGQNGAVDVGIYHLIDYTGTLSGQQQATLLPTRAGQMLSYVHDDAAKSVDVMVAQVTTDGRGRGGTANTSGTGTATGADNTGAATAHEGTTGGTGTSGSGEKTQQITLTSWSGGDAVMTSYGVFDGQMGSPIAPPNFVGSGGTITVEGSGSQPTQASVVNFGSGGYALTGGGLAAVPTSSGQNMLGVNAEAGRSGTIATSIVDDGPSKTGLMKTGTGTVTLAGRNDYGGATGVLAGTLDVARNAVISDRSQVSVAQGAELDVAGQVGRIVNNGTLSVTGQTGDVSNSSGQATISGTGQVASMTNMGTVQLSGQGRVTGTLDQQSGMVTLADSASIGTLKSNGSQELDQAAGLDRTDGRMSASRQAYVEAQLSRTTDPQTRSLLLAVHDSMTGNSGAVLGDLKGAGNLFVVADNAKAGIGTLTGYGTGYLGNGSTLTLTGSNTSYGDALFGQGGLIVQGQNVVFRGTNYYSGGTEIAQEADVTAGTQSLGTNGIAVDGTLTVEENGTESLDNSLSGSGTFNKTGTGFLTLAQSVDDSHFDGTTNVRQGGLAVNGTLGGATNVAAGAMISGSGTVHNLSLDPNASLGVTLDGGKGAATSLTLAGTENHLNGAQVAATVSNLSSMAMRQHYRTTILKLADGALATGTLGEKARMSSSDEGAVSPLSTAFLRGTVSEAQDGRSWIMDYVRVANFNAYAQDRNERQVAGSLDRAGTSAGFMDALAGSAMQTGEQVRGAYNALSGEINASAKTAMVNDSFYVQETVVDRLDCAGDALRAHAHDGREQTSGYCDVDPTRHVSVWGTVYGQKGGQSGGAAGAGHMGQSSVGWIMGADTGLKGGWRLGGLLAYGRDWFSVQSGRGSSAHANSATIGAYVGNAWRVGGLTDNAAITFKGGLSYSWNMLHTSRRVTYGDYAGRLSSNNRTGTGQAFVETGYRMVFASESRLPLEVEPFARMTYLNYDQTGFHEHGAETALAVKGRNSSIGFSTVGVKLATSVNIGRVIFSPHLEAGYRRAFGRTNASVREGFSTLGDGYGMSVQGTPLSVSTAQINTGFAAHLTDRIDVNVDYVGQYGGHQTSSGGSGNFRYKF
ncbi:autotransporter domain-containing protein [Bombella sp. ESL0380]|nr:autotransporter domain-containing protein [Bombella sp. ESL0380]